MHTITSTTITTTSAVTVTTANIDTAATSIITKIKGIKVKVLGNVDGEFEPNQTICACSCKRAYQQYPLKGFEYNTRNFQEC